MDKIEKVARAIRVELGGCHGNEFDLSVCTYMISGGNCGCADLARVVIEAMMDWQPIASAPKDGTRVLATDGSNVEVIYHAEGLGWFNQSSEMSMWRAFPPTHWMPLPDPPK